MLKAAPRRASVGTAGLPVLAAALSVLWGSVAAPSARADSAPAGLTVQFPAVITTDTAARLRAAVYAPQKRYEAERQRDGDKSGPFKLLCDFNPDGRPNATDDFGACSDLAEVIRDLQEKGVQTRAYVHGEVSRQAVLPVLACGEIVLSADPPARFGRIVDPDRTLSPFERPAYEAMTKGRFPLALVRKMYDRDLAVVQVFPAPKNGDRYLGAREAADARLNAQPVADLGPGALAFYDFAQAKELGLCLPDAENTLADALDDFKLPRSSIFPLLDHTTAVLVVAHGEVNGQLKEDVERRLNRALGDKANVLILRLECAAGEGGDDRTACDLAQFIAGLKDRADKPLKTIAYVTPSSRDVAVFLALACDQIVMQKDARLGDFDNYLKAHPDRAQDLRRELRDTAEREFYPPLLAVAMADRDDRILEAESTKGAGEVRFLTEAEMNDDPKSEHPHGWRSKGEVKPAGTYLTLNAEDARKYGLAQDVAASYEDLCAMEGVSPTEVTLIDADWLNALAEFLCNPWTTFILVTLGVTCLIIELKMPGASLPGVIAAVCFVLFFWSQSQLHGQITWLAVLLFLLGLILIGIEVFILPGTGVCGISGALLTVGGLALVAFGHLPQTSEDWMGFGKKLGPFAVGILVAFVLAFTAVRYLKHIPFLNRLMLKPQTEEGEDGEWAPEPIRPELAALLGAIGVAATPLRPAGKTQFGEQFVDVIAEGGYVQPGTRVQVIEIEGNRVVVKVV